MTLMMHHEYSWCIMSTHDASCMSTHDSSWVLMMHHEYSWCIDTYSWCIMSPHDESWVLMRHHEYLLGRRWMLKYYAWQQKKTFLELIPGSPRGIPRIADRVPQPPVGTSLPHAQRVRMTWVQNKIHEITKIGPDPKTQFVFWKNVQDGFRISPKGPETYQEQFPCGIANKYRRTNSKLNCLGFWVTSDLLENPRDFLQITDLSFVLYKKQS